MTVFRIVLQVLALPPKAVRFDTYAMFFMKMEGYFISSCLIWNKANFWVSTHWELWSLVSQIFPSFPPSMKHDCVRYCSSGFGAASQNCTFWHVCRVFNENGSVFHLRLLNLKQKASFWVSSYCCWSTLHILYFLELMLRYKHCKFYNQYLPVNLSMCDISKASGDDDREYVYIRILNILSVRSQRWLLFTTS